MAANTEFVTFLEAFMRAADNGIIAAKNQSNVGAHVFCRAQKAVLEEVLEKYYQTHVDESERSGAV